MRPAGTDDLDEEALAALVTRDGMIGTALAVNGAADLGGMMGFGPVVAGAGERALPRRVGAPGARARARDGRGRAVEHRREPATRARACRRRSTSRRPTTRSGRWAWSGCWSRRPRRGGRAGRGPGARAGVADARLDPGRGQDGVRGRAARTRDPRRRRPGSRSATRSAPACCTPPATPGCPATRAARSATIERVHGAHVLPDSNAHGDGRAARVALHGALHAAGSCGARPADPTLTVAVDAWESLPRTPGRCG